MEDEMLAEKMLMAKEREEGDEEEKEIQSLPVYLPLDLHKEIKLMSTHLGMKIKDYVNSKLTIAVEKDKIKLSRALQKEEKPEVE